MILLIQPITDGCWIARRVIIISFKKDVNNEIYSISKKKNLIKYFINNEAIFAFKSWLNKI